MNIFNPSNYIFLDLSLAKDIGIYPALFLSLLVFKVNPKDYLYDNVDFYNHLETFLCENKLILKNDETGETSLNEEQLLQRVINLKETPKIENKKTPTKRLTKADAIKTQLKTNILTENIELRQAYEDWIDAVYARNGWMSKKAVITGQQLVTTFSEHNLDVALKVIEIASVNGLRDMNWAIENYKKYYGTPVKSNRSKVTPKNIELSGDVF